VAIKDFFIGQKNCSRSDEVLTGVEIPFTDEVRGQFVNELLLAVELYAFLNVFGYNFCRTHIRLSASYPSVCPSICLSVIHLY